MTEAATQEKGVAEMSDAEMLQSLTEMFDAEVPSDNSDEVQAVEDVEPTVDDQVDDGETVEESDTDEDTDESEAEDQVDDGDEESSDDEKWVPQSLDELAEALETAPEDLMTVLKVKTKVDGQEGEATLKDVIKSYQLEKTLNGRLEVHANERKAFEAETSKVVQTLQERLQDVELTASAMEQLLLTEYQSTDWSELKDNDPTEYMLKQQEMRDQYAKINQVKEKLNQDRSKATQEQQQAFQQQVQQQLAYEKQALLDKMPEWQDNERAKEGLTKVTDYLKAEGYQPQEIDSIVDHRAFVIAEKARRYDEMQTKADPKMKQMKTKPKFVKPGARKDPAKVSEKRKTAAMSRAKKLQTDEAWAEALLAKFS